MTMTSWRITPILAMSAIVLAGSPVEAGPVAIDAESPVVESSSVRLSAVGRGVIPVRGGLLVLSQADLGLTEVSFLASGAPADQGQPEVTVLGEVAAQGNRLVAVDTAGRSSVEEEAVENPLAPVLRIFRTPVDGFGAFEETGVAVLPETVEAEIRRFGTALAIGGNAIAVVSETASGNDRVDIFRISPEGTAVWSQELNPRTLDTSVAVSSSGATIALTGVNRLAASGEVIVNQIGPGGWVPTQRFLRIGGGPVFLKDNRMLVQRNSFFARPSGSWTVIDSLPGRPFEVANELPVEGSSVDFIGGLVAVGDPENELVYLLEETPSEFRFAQAIRPGRSGPSGDSSRFGAAVALLDSGSLVVGSPGPGASSQAGEVYSYTIIDGPVGCTIVGTEGSDELEADSLPPLTDTVCGLGGDDVLVGSQATDTLLGGPGDDELRGSAAGGLLDGGPGVDTCEQQGPATGPVITVSCEP